ncbi:MAG: calcium-binding protein, partial [Cyanobacteria bacterium J06623_7]
MSNSEQIENSFTINSEESVTISETIIAAQNPAIDIPGSDASLTIDPTGAILASESGSTSIGVAGDDVNVSNQGTIAGSLNGIDIDGSNFNLDNSGLVSSDSRAVQIDNGNGSQINNSGAILGTDNQRNGTIYANDTANNYTINNSGLIDTGEGNNGAAVS